MLAPLRGRLRRSLTGSLPRAVLNLAVAGKRPFNRTGKHPLGRCGGANGGVNAGAFGGAFAGVNTGADRPSWGYF